MININPQQVFKFGVNKTKHQYNILSQFKHIMDWLETGQDVWMLIMEHLVTTEQARMARVSKYFKETPLTLSRIPIAIGPVIKYPYPMLGKALKIANVKYEELYHPLQEVDKDRMATYDSNRLDGSLPTILSRITTPPRCHQVQELIEMNTTIHMGELRCTIHFPNLRILSLYRCNIISSIDTYPRTACTALCQLEELYLSRVPMRDLLITLYTPNLKILVFDTVIFIDLEVVSTRCPKLEHLVTPNVGYLGKNTLPRTMKSCTISYRRNLRLYEDSCSQWTTLNINTTNHNRVTMAAILEIAHQNPYMKLYCREDYDYKDRAVQIRAHGTTTSIKREERKWPFTDDVVPEVFKF